MILGRNYISSLWIVYSYYEWKQLQLVVKVNKGWEGSQHTGCLTFLCCLSELSRGVKPWYCLLLDVYCLTLFRTRFSNMLLYTIWQVFCSCNLQIESRQKIDWFRYILIFHQNKQFKGLGLPNYTSNTFPHLHSMKYETMWIFFVYLPKFWKTGLKDFYVSDGVSFVVLTEIKNHYKD